MSQRLVFLRTTASATVWASLLSMSLFAGCVFDEKWIPVLKQRYLQYYSIGEPVGEVWSAALEEVRAQNPSRDLVSDPNFHIISWAEDARWDTCDRTVRHTSNRSHVATAVTVIRIKPSASGSRVFVRRVCYPHTARDRTRMQHGMSLGVFEHAFVERLRKRLAR